MSREIKLGGGVVKWIKITDKYPDQGESVLLYMPALYGLVVGKLEYKYYDTDDTERYWSVEVKRMYIDREMRAATSFISDVLFDEVTHWMPLPELP